MVKPLSGPSVQTLRRTIMQSDGKEKVINLVKENGKLTGAVFSKIENGKVYDVQNYRLGNNEATPMLVDNIKERIKIYCEKAKDGAKLFADIMGWLK